MTHNPARGRRLGGSVSRRTSIPMRSGVDHSLEEQADAILADGRRGVTEHSKKKDYLTEAQLQNRYAREVYTSSGVPDKNIISGLFRRAYAPPRRSGPRKPSEYTDE